MRPKAFHDLWTLAKSLVRHSPAGRKHGPSSTFDCPAVGLLLEPKEARWEYLSTPLNADTFASTGIDGVHFSFLALDDSQSQVQPVVMTVPMADGQNIIVGSDLTEFLALGFHSGYISLDQLAFDRDTAIQEIECDAHADEHDRYEVELLQAIRTRFNLEPWANVRLRLDELSHEFDSHIRLPVP